MKKSFKFRLKAGKQTFKNVEKWLNMCCWLYNTALEQRISAYKTKKKSVNYYNQNNELPILKKEIPDFKEIGSQVLQDVLKRLDRAYSAFFRRVKPGETAGFPRFKGRDRYDSFTLPSKQGWKLQGHYIKISGIGIFRIKMHRPVKGEIKTVTIKKTKTDKWFIIFSCDNVSSNKLPKTGKQIGIDVGCESFLVDNENNIVENPRFFKKSQKQLTSRQQRFATKKKSSNNRKKTKLLVAKSYEHISNQRRDFHFKLANKLVKENDTIFIEDMNAWNTKSKALNKSMRDVAWFQFFDILTFKAEEAGKEIIKVPAAGTSQACSACGVIVKKDLSEREHICPDCGFKTSRDHNAALNIFGAGKVLWYKSSHVPVPKNPEI